MPAMLVSASLTSSKVVTCVSVTYWSKWPRQVKRIYYFTLVRQISPLFSPLPLLKLGQCTVHTNAFDSEIDFAEAKAEKSKWSLEHRRCYKPSSNTYHMQAALSVSGWMWRA